jgi:adenosylcobalamin-dependent ribonucleoside-triphosphate reductase
MFLSQDFLEKYPNNPRWPSLLGQFVYLRTYSRFLPELNRREHWKETVRRVVEYSIGLDTITERADLVQEAEELFDAMFNLKVFPAGRTLWTGGTEAAKKYPMSNFNCSFTIVDSFDAFFDAFYLMMLGTGVGFRVLPEDVAKLPKIKRGVNLFIEPYSPVAASKRTDLTTIERPYENVAAIIIGDSKEGWVDGLKYLMHCFTEGIINVSVNVNNVRPSGEPLKTFGGRASGPQALINMYTKIVNILNAGDADNDSISTLEAMDIMNLIGEAVVVGGVRRSSEITLFDINDKLVMDAKLGLWTDESKKDKRHRSMSNNSVYFTQKPTREQLHDIFNRVMDNGEPGFINAEAAAARRKWYAGTNPCAEILLADNGVCNLSEVNVNAFIEPHGESVRFDFSGFMDAIRLATRIGVRMATLELELPHWNRVQARDRLTGVSLTGYVQAMDALEYDTTKETWELKNLLVRANMEANQEAVNYAVDLRIPPPLLVTCVKPSGTIAQLPTVSSGAHASFAPYYIRRVRISSTDPLAKAMRAAGFPIYPEANWAMPSDYDAMNDEQKDEVLKNALTWVIEFPIKTSAHQASSEETAVAQLSRYFILQKYWTDHNTSITVSFSPEEVSGIIEYLLLNWDDYIGVSFLPKSGGSYPLMPYEQIDEQEYIRRSELIAHVNEHNISSLLEMFEGVSLVDEALDADCEGGACPIR